MISLVFDSVYAANLESLSSNPGCDYRPHLSLTHLVTGPERVGRGGVIYVPSLQP